MPKYFIMEIIQWGNIQNECHIKSIQIVYGNIQNQCHMDTQHTIENNTPSKITLLASHRARMLAMPPVKFYNNFTAQDLKLEQQIELATCTWVINDMYEV